MYKIYIYSNDRSLTFSIAEEFEKYVVEEFTEIKMAQK